MLLFMMCYQWDIGDKKERKCYGRKHNVFLYEINHESIVLFFVCLYCVDLAQDGTIYENLLPSDWPVGMSWLILTWEGSSHYWRWHPVEDGYSSYKKAIWVNHGKQVSKNHSSIASTSASVSRFLLWVPFLVSFNYWFKQVRYNKHFLCSSCSWSVAFLSYHRNRNQSMSVLFNQILKYPDNF